MAKHLKLRIKEFLDQRGSVLWEDHERQYASQKLFEMFDRELQKVTPKNTLLTQIEHYKRVLRFAKVPKFIIENPQFLNSIPPTQQEIDNAKEQIRVLSQNKAV